MMSRLKTNLQNILQEKEQKIIPENIKSGVQIFDIVGTYGGSGIDTSDATATADDIAQNKTAYVNGEKLTGALYELNASDTDSRVIIDSEHSTYIHPDNMSVYFPAYFGELARWDCIAYEGAFVDTHNFIVRNDGIQYVYTVLEKSKLASDIGLTADKIKAGETILGITGTYTGEEDISL